MPTVAANDLVKLVSRFKLNGLHDFQNAWSFIVGTGGTFTAAVLQTAAQNWLDAVFDSLIGHITSALDPYDIKIDRVVWNAATQRTDIAENLLFAPWTMAVPPNSGGEALPQQTAPIINFRTARPQTVGRKFLPMFTEAENTGGGGISGAAVANMVLAAADSLLTMTVGTATLNPCVFSPYSGLFAHAFPLLAASVNPIMKTQRRRVTGVGS